MFFRALRARKVTFSFVNPPKFFSGALRAPESKGGVYPDMAKSAGGAESKGFFLPRGGGYAELKCSRFFFTPLIKHVFLHTLGDIQWDELA